MVAIFCPSPLHTMIEIVSTHLKIRQFQNEFMQSSFLPKYEEKIVKISAFTTQSIFSLYFGRNDDFKNSL